VEVTLYQKKRRFQRAQVDRVLSAAPERVTPPCPYFGTCGGCQWQHIAYPAQLAFKRHIVAEQLRRIGGFENAASYVREAIGSPLPYYYRNHARFTVGRAGNLGFTHWASHRFLPIRYCYLMQPPINAALATLQGRTYVKHQLTVRHGTNTGDALIFPHVSDAPVPTGQTTLTEEVFGIRFQVSASSFFQVNTVRGWRRLPDHWTYPGLPPREGAYSQTEMIGYRVLDFIAPSGEETIVDAYAGVGTFTLLFAPRVRRLIAIEESASAVRDAEVNAARAAARNVEIVRAKVEHALPQLAEPVDAVIIDPARPGLHPDVVDALLRLGAPKLAYVSCEPATLARDLRLLVDGGYRLLEVQPIDMFPQTYHIESVSLLVR
jgi:23S rRNA (uracil1939-C5)-methyltransferase